MSLVIGCDIGTQSAKGVLVASGGEVLASAKAVYDVDFPQPGWAEQDPADWITAAESVLAELAAAATDHVDAVGVAAQVDGVVALDQKGLPLHPALIWMDRRATDETRLLAERLGEERIFELTGLNCDASHGAPKIMWLQDHLDSSPARYECPAQFVVRWLTGESVQDHANASSSMLFDVSEGQWSTDMVDVTHIEPDTLGRILEPQDAVGILDRRLSESLGFARPPVIVVGTGDDHAAAVGCMATKPGVVADITGTAEPIGTMSPRPTLDMQRLLETHRHAVPGTFLIENPGFVSGGSVLWAASALGIPQEEVLRMAADAPPGSKGLVFIPALSGAVAPRWSEKHRGSFVGLSMDHGAPEMCRAILEGCSFAFRDNLNRMEEMGLPVERTHVTGGGARSQIWLQIKADVSGLPIQVVAGEATALGAACLAAVAAGWFEDVVAASDHLSSLLDRPYLPNEANRDLYEESHQLYLNAFDALDPVYRR